MQNEITVGGGALKRKCKMQNAKCRMQNEITVGVGR